MGIMDMMMEDIAIFTPAQTIKVISAPPICTFSSFSHIDGFLPFNFTFITLDLVSDIGEPALTLGPLLAFQTGQAVPPLTLGGPPGVPVVGGHGGQLGPCVFLNQDVHVIGNQLSSISCQSSFSTLHLELHSHRAHQNIHDLDTTLSLIFS